MALTITTTAGSASANAYCTLEQAEAYVATLVWSSDWTGKTDEQKKAAIINAARLLDTLQFKGSRADEAQAMAWPRINVVDRDGYEVDSATVPAAVVNANAEFALRLFAEDRAADAGAIVPERVKLGQMEVEKQRRQMIPASVRDLLSGLLATTGGVITGVRG